MQSLSIVNFHYVRDVPVESGIAACSISRFCDQLDYLQRDYQFVTAQEIIGAIRLKASLPANACWLTFDDGYLDHYKNVFPILLERGIQGIFFPPAAPVLNREVLDVNKIQFLLAGDQPINKYIETIKQYVLDCSHEHSLLTIEEYWENWAEPSRFGDSVEVTFVKRMMQVALPFELRHELLSSLFRTYVSSDEASFADDLYMTFAQLQEMVAAGMYVGHHGYRHEWLNHLSESEQISELTPGIGMLKNLDLFEGGWIMSYPFGAWNDTLLRQLQRLGCVAGVTVNPSVADIGNSNPLLLERFDTKDFPADVGDVRIEEVVKPKPVVADIGLYQQRSELVHGTKFLSAFETDSRTLEVKYGLPAEVRFCRHCVISNQRPNSEVEFRHTAETAKKTINFDEEGVCDACRITQKKRSEIDWGDREEQLIELCDRYRKDGSTYDCLVPGSGGKDSVFAAHVLKHKYGMTPLTVTWAPHIYTDRGWQNFQAWVGSGFDNYLMTPNGRTHRLLTRVALENLFHPFQPFMLGQKALAPKMAAKFDISLVFYGENEAEYGNPIKDSESARRDWSYFSGDDLSKIYLGGISIQELNEDMSVSKADLSPYLPMSPDEIGSKGIDVHYLGYYLPWHPQGAYYYAVENGGFQASPERSPGTYSKYNSIDDKIDDFHYYTTFVKFGIGRATYDAAQEIRNDEITREEGVALVKKYDGEFPNRFAEEIFGYLSMPESEYPVASHHFAQEMLDKDYFDDLTDYFRSPHIWKRDSGAWSLRHTVWCPMDSA